MGTVGVARSESLIAELKNPIPAQRNGDYLCERPTCSSDVTLRQNLVGESPALLCEKAAIWGDFTLAGLLVKKSKPQIHKDAGVVKATRRPRHSWSEANGQPNVAKGLCQRELVRKTSVAGRGGGELHYSNDAAHWRAVEAENCGVELAALEDPV